MIDAFSSVGAMLPVRVTCSVSIVVFHPDLEQLRATLRCLVLAAREVSIELFVIDNGGLADIDAEHWRPSAGDLPLTIFAGHGNVGYGLGHNLAIGHASSRFHLVLNPDAELDADALSEAFAFFGAHPDAGLIAPQVRDEHGQQQFLCRRQPSVFVLFARGFLPNALCRPFIARLARYEMRDVINARDVVWDPPIVSGCCMLFRTDVLKALRGFDSRYFLYFEDYDLSLRTHKQARVAYVPSVRVVHHGGGAARKGWTHIYLFLRSAREFFNRFGWRWL